MTDTLEKPGMSVVDVDDWVVQLNVEIAQRADQLAQSQGGSPTRETDLHYWLEAEREVLEELEFQHH